MNPCPWRLGSRVRNGITALLVGAAPLAAATAPEARVGPEAGSAPESMELTLELAPREAEELSRHGWHAAGLGPGWALTAEGSGPLLPARVTYVDLPPGTRAVGVEVLSAETREIAAADPPPAEPLPPGMPAPPAGVGPAVSAPEVGPDGATPAWLVELGSGGAAGGVEQAALVFHALRYAPAEGMFLVHDRVRVRLVYAPMNPAAAAARPPLARRSPAPGRGERVAIRPGDLPRLDGSVVEHLIITDAGMECEFQRLADWRTAQGHPSAVRTVTWIEAHYADGVDLADRIRAFLRDAYEMWGTRWVLLGGDTETIPVRMAHIDYYYYPSGEDIATDLFYATLDGSWDGDGDGRYGEGHNVTFGAPGDSVDLYPELFVGRLPCQDAEEARILVDKTLRYENPTCIGYQTNALFAAEVVFPYSWDGNPATIELNGCDIAHQAGDHVPPGWQARYLCQYPGGNLEIDSLVAALDQGYALVNLVDHGDPFKLRVTGGTYLRESDVAALANDGCFSVFYYSNCSTSAIDLECLNESLMLNPHGGAVGTIAPSRLAFPLKSQYYQEEFYRLFFTTDTRTLGELFNGSLLPYIGLTWRDDSAWRWSHLSSLLLGDPGLPVWKKVPAAMAAGHEGVMAAADTTYTVTVSAGGDPLAGAVVTLWKKDTGEYARGLSDDSGLVVLPFRPGGGGTAALQVSHADYRPVSGSVTVEEGSARLYVSGFTVDDDAIPPSLGNGDGRADAGERIELGVTLANGGGADASGVEAALGVRPGASFTASLAVDGSSAPGLVFVGRGRTHPDALPLSYGLGSGELGGRPAYTAAAPDDSLGPLVDPPLAPVSGRFYLWEDASGWHLRAAGGREEHLFTGSLVADGELLGLEPADLEPGDSFTRGANGADFTFGVDSADVEDGLDLVWGDSLFARVLDGAESFGAIPAGGAATRTFLVELATAAAAEHVTRFDLDVSGGAGTWADGLRLEIGAPALKPYYQEVDDGGAGGNGNGIGEPGETVTVLFHVLNEGNGTAEGVAGKLRALGGAVVLDSTDLFGAIRAGGLAAGQGGMRAVLSAPSPTLEIELEDAAGRHSVRTFSLEPPVGVAGIGRVPPPVPGAGGVDLGWEPASAPDLLGYLVYRAETESGAPERVSDRLLERTAYYHDALARAGTTYWYRVAAVDSGGTRGPISPAVPVPTLPALVPGWPVVTGDVIWSSPVMVDLGEDADGDQELACGSKDFGAYLWDAHGRALPGWPLFTGNEIWSSPAAGDLDGDDRPELVFAGNDGNVYAWHADGTGLLSPNGLFARPSPAGELRSSPTLADLDLDGELEILAGSSNGRLYAWRANGESYLPAGAVFAHPANGPLMGSPAVAQVDADPLPEVFIGSLGTAGTGKMWAFQHDGAGLTSPTGEFATVPGGIWSSPSVGDLDDDGTQEIVVGGLDGKAYVWEAAGAPRGGWPKSTGGAIWSSPALGDLDGDGMLEVVIGSLDHRVYAWRADGAFVPGWPCSTDFEVWGSPILVDVDDDFRPEVVAGSVDGMLYAWGGDAVAVPGWPLRTGEAIYGSPAAGDVDGDGTLEIAVGSYDGKMHVWRVGVPYNAGASPWPMFDHDAWRSGWFERPQAEGPGRPPADEQRLPARDGLGPVLPNPFGGRTVLRYQLARESRVEFSIYDVTGRRVATIERGPRPAGYHSAAWDGREASGRPAAAGVYFARLEAAGTRYEQKIILLR